MLHLSFIVFNVTCVFRYVERVSEMLRQKMKQADILVLKGATMAEKRQEALQEQSRLEPRVDLLAGCTRELQKLVQHYFCICIYVKWGGCRKQQILKTVTVRSLFKYEQTHKGIHILCDMETVQILSVTPTMFSEVTDDCYVCFHRSRQTFQSDTTTGLWTWWGLIFSELQTVTENILSWSTTEIKKVIFNVNFCWVFFLFFMFLYNCCRDKEMSNVENTKTW